jgi:hypothetical protein
MCGAEETKMSSSRQLQHFGVALGAIARAWSKAEKRGWLSPHFRFQPTGGFNRQERRRAGAVMRKMAKTAKREQEAKARWLDSLYHLATT